MAGRPDFTTPGTQGSGQTVAVQNRPEIATVDLTDDSTATPGEYVKSEVYAPTGSIYRLRGMYLRAEPIGSGSTGTHRFYLTNTNGTRTLEGKSQYNSRIIFQYYNWKIVDTQQPDTDAALVGALKSMTATENSPITVVYNNDSDADQVDARDIKLLFEEESY